LPQLTRWLAEFAKLRTPERALSYDSSSGTENNATDHCDLDPIDKPGPVSPPRVVEPPPTSKVEVPLPQASQNSASVCRISVGPQTVLTPLIEETSSCDSSTAEPSTTEEPSQSLEDITLSLTQDDEGETTEEQMSTSIINPMDISTYSDVVRSVANEHRQARSLATVALLAHQRSLEENREEAQEEDMPLNELEQTETVEAPSCTEAAAEAVSGAADTSCDDIRNLSIEIDEILRTPTPTPSSECPGAPLKTAGSGLVDHVQSYVSFDQDNSEASPKTVLCQPQSLFEDAMEKIQATCGSLSLNALSPSPIKVATPPHAFEMDPRVLFDKESEPRDEAPDLDKTADLSETSSQKETEDGVAST